MITIRASSIVHYSNNERESLPFSPRLPSSVALSLRLQPLKPEGPLHCDKRVYSEGRHSCTNVHKLGDYMFCWILLGVKMCLRSAQVVMGRSTILVYITPGTPMHCNRMF